MFVAALAVLAPWTKVEAVIEKSCKFCDVSSQKGFNVVWENDKFVAFRDHKPAAQCHIQLIPKHHIRSVRSLRQEDVELVKTMQTIGNRILEENHIEPPNRRMGFHIPPFNSVYHLHLHLIGQPFVSGRKERKYPISLGDGVTAKGWSWFAEVGQVIRILEAGGEVGISPC